MSEEEERKIRSVSEMRKMKRQWSCEWKWEWNPSLYTQQDNHEIETNFRDKK